ncbi:hypothetical protein Cfor_08763 [Coptotermes formosanus]|uniref:DUF6451 domain-containing protein n=1 Tax=Coptotermes formosanus TaxID=36987 RepID=A0A6L2Q4F7_COPFO|nr:hypothetical protein Cfor_08763 [Coptotermes formosanus]
MRIAMNNNEALCIHGETIERVTQFTYLGSIIDNTGDTEADTTARIRTAQTTFSALNKIWHSTAYSTQTKLRIFNTNVKSVLLYGCETWKNSKGIAFHSSQAAALQMQLRRHIYRRTHADSHDFFVK